MRSEQLSADCACPVCRGCLCSFGCSVHRARSGYRRGRRGGANFCDPSTRTGRVVSAVAAVEDEVRELVRRRGLDPVEQSAAVRRLVDEVIADYGERSIAGALAPLPDTRAVARVVFDAVAGFGPLQPYLDDPLVGEIWINEPTKVFIVRAGVHELTERESRLTLQAIADRLNADGIRTPTGVIWGPANVSGAVRSAVLEREARCAAS
jgi:hypothetical protein